MKSLNKKVILILSFLLFSPKKLIDFLSRFVEEPWRRRHKKFFFPIIRQVFPDLVVGDIVGVQPMQGPVGQVFYMDFKYKSPHHDRCTIYLEHLKKAYEFDGVNWIEIKSEIESDYVLGYKGCSYMEFVGSPEIYCPYLPFKTPIVGYDFRCK